MLHISLAAERLWTVGGLPISNALLTTWLVTALLALLSYLATRKMTKIPGNAQLIAESVIGGLYDFFGAIAGKHISQFFPVVASFFIFILVANWVGLLPGVSTIGFYRSQVHEVATAGSAESASVPAEEGADAHIAKETKPEEERATTSAVQAAEGKGENGHGKTVFVPLFRAATADLNTTLALAAVSVIAMQYFGFKNLGAHYASRFFNLKDPILFGVGILELASDISKVVSFAFRLFGNIFAGEVLLAVIAFLMPFIVPLPFLLMELFVGIVQALVFSMLTTAFLSVAVAHGEGEHVEQSATHASA